MSRYVAFRPKLAPDWVDDDYSLGGYTVFEPEKLPEPTGLYDQHGNELYRMPESHPMGFDITPKRRVDTAPEAPKGQPAATKKGKTMSKAKKKGKGGRC